ncbi:MAG: hypothetical protein WCP79_06000 [Bacillota bacterium]
MKFFCNACFHKIFFFAILPLFAIYEIFFVGCEAFMINRLADMLIGFLIAIDVMGILAISLKQVVTVRPRYDGYNGTRESDRNPRNEFDTERE